MWCKLAWLCFTALAAVAQNTIHAESGPWTASLDGIWRWHAGDDLRWASPSFDDTNWPALRVPGPPQPTLPPNGVRGLARSSWMRIPIETGRMSDPALLLGPLAFSYQVYWDGQQIGQFGELSRGHWFIPRWQTFRLPRPLTTSGHHVLALRVGQIGVGFIPRLPWLSAGHNRIGNWTALHEAESAYMRSDFQTRLWQLLIDFGLLLAGVYFMLLPPSLSPGSAFRWLGVILCGRALFVLCDLYAGYGPLNLSADLLLSLACVLPALYVIATIEFAYSFFHRPVPLGVRLVECVVALLAVPVPLTYTTLSIKFSSYLASVPITIPLAVAEFRKRTVGAVFALVLFTLWGVVTVDIVLVVAYRIQVLGAINPAGYKIYVSDVVLLIWVPAIAMQIHKTNLRFRDERERLRGEMEAAREVQKLLVPAHSVQVRGFDIEASYRPAAEVGGDFFQLFPASKDSLLVVVGDVSGKSMKAALLVSVIVGALQNRKSDQPAEVLGELNSVLLGRSEGGFTTCCCALFSSAGKLTLANAGHLAPYRNGTEIATPPGLPLGIDADVHWSEMHVDLDPSDRILWVSDGVVEARNAKHDLLGFERAQELATRSVSEIAQAAQQFGQDDDITVVSITRQPVPAYVA